MLIHRIVVVAASTVAALTASSAAPAQSALDARQAQVETSLAPQVVPSYGEIPQWTIEERMAHYNVPGISIAVFEDGEVSWSAAYGVADRETGRPLTPDTYFQAASISKAIAAFAAMRLVQDDILSLDAPVNTLLTSWQLEDNEFTAQENVTLRHLISHMAGLNVSGFSGYTEGEALPSLQQILSGEPPANSERLQVVETPGERIRYSGGGTQLVEALIVDQTQETYSDIVQRTIFDPVGMSRSMIAQPLPIELREQSARSHTGEHSEPLEGFSNTYRELAAGGVWSTPTDLAQLGAAFANALNGDETGFISPTTAREMTRPQFNDTGSLGPFVWTMPDGEMFGHTGGNAGFRSNFYGFTDGRGGAVIMTNSDSGFSLIWEVMASLANTYDWSYGATRVREAVPITAEIAHAVSGVYQAQLNWTNLNMTIENRDGELFFTALPVQSEAPLYHAGGDTFFLSTGTSIVLQYDEDGNIAGFNSRMEGGLYAERVYDHPAD